MNTNKLNGNSLNGNKLNRERAKTSMKVREVPTFKRESDEESKTEKNVKTVSLLLTSLFIALVVFITLMGVAYKNTIDTYIEYDKVHYEMYGETLSDK